MGEKILGTGGLVDRLLSALVREKLRVLASAQGSSESSISFVVTQHDMKAALITAHRELQLSVINSPAHPKAIL